MVPKIELNVVGKINLKTLKSIPIKPIKIVPTSDVNGLKVSIEQSNRIQEIAQELLKDPMNVELRKYYEELRYISGM